MTKNQSGIFCAFLLPFAKGSRRNKGSRKNSRLTRTCELLPLLPFFFSWMVEKQEKGQKIFLYACARARGRAHWYGFLRVARVAGCPQNLRVRRLA